MNRSERAIAAAEAELRFLLERDDWAEPDEYGYSVKEHVGSIADLLHQAR